MRIIPVVGEEYIWHNLQEGIDIKLRIRVLAINQHGEITPEILKILSNKCRGAQTWIKLGRIESKLGTVSAGLLPLYDPVDILKEML